MTYDYTCSKCETTFELNLTIARRDEPISQPCPNCKKKKCVTRVVNSLPISYDTMNPIRRAGSGWNDVLKKISAGAGKRRSTIEHY